MINIKDVDQVCQVEQINRLASVIAVSSSAHGGAYRRTGRASPGQGEELGGSGRNTEVHMGLGRVLRLTFGLATMSRAPSAI